ncbi:MAG: organic solvent transporter ATP-binding protein [Bacteroidetes bacterium]|nr:organic solvent transporter ATP-binding protein [Bacteroidota bacterium]
MEQKETLVMEQMEIDPEKNALELKNIKKSFNGDISFKLNKGENLVVLGKSGSGKSVLIKCIVRLIETDSGEILVFGKNVSSLEAEELNITRKKIGFLFQSGALYDSMSVRENLEFPLRDKKNLSENDITAMVEASLSDVGLSDVIDKMPSELSGGMRKRLGLARTMILKPDIMLYDEPTTGLDPITSKEISKLILEVQKKNRTSSIIITHDVECAKITANRIIVIKDGLIAAEGTFSELLKSEDEWIRSFFE